MKWLQKLVHRGDYGLTPHNPVRCGGGPLGERSYLEKLRCPSGQRVKYRRAGSIVLTHGNAIDRYDVMCQCGQHQLVVYMDMYARRKDRPIGAADWTLEEPFCFPHFEFTSHGNEITLAEIIRRMREDPDMAGSLGDDLRQIGENPAPAIIQQVRGGRRDESAVRHATYQLAFVGKEAIPHLMALLGDDDDDLGALATIALPGIEGSLEFVIEALNSENPRIRLRAAASLPNFGQKAKEAVPALLQMINTEKAAERHEFVSGIGASALVRLKDMALPFAEDLLNDNDDDVRHTAVHIMWLVGKPALPLLRAWKRKETDTLISHILSNSIRSIERA